MSGPRHLGQRLAQNAGGLLIRLLELAQERRRPRASVERGALWQAEHWIGAVRDHAITRACRRIGLPAAYAKGAHALPHEITRELEGALVRALDRAELRRALHPPVEDVMPAQPDEVSGVGRRHGSRMGRLAEEDTACAAADGTERGRGCEAEVDLEGVAEQKRAVGGLPRSAGRMVDVPEFTMDGVAPVFEHVLEGEPRATPRKRSMSDQRSSPSHAADPVIAAPPIRASARARAISSLRDPIASLGREHTRTLRGVVSPPARTLTAMRCRSGRESRPMIPHARRRCIRRRRAGRAVPTARGKVTT
jgi:hypothetical protein